MLASIFQAQVYRVDVEQSRDSGKRETQHKTTNSGRYVIIKGYRGCSVGVGVDEKSFVDIGIQLLRWWQPPFNTLQHEPMPVRWPLTFKFEV